MAGPQYSDALDKILDALLDADKSRREEILAAMQMDNPALAERVRQLLGFALDDKSLARDASTLAPDLFRSLNHEHTEARIGEKAGAFKIDELIAKGGMGEIYRAHRIDGVYEQTVAIKLLPRSKMTKTRQELFDTERTILARLEHPNIAHVIDGGWLDDGTPYLAMEFVDGEPLDIAVKGQAKRDKLSLFHQICDAVSFCHRSFIVHGDLKPSNIMVSSGRIKILDLGVSQRISETDKISSNAFGATREFASPEVLDGSSPMIASDVFALGKILDLVFPNSQTNQELKAIISKSLEINPKDRYQSVEALSADLRALSTGHPISAIPNSRYYRSAKFFQRNPLLSASVFVTIISLGAGLVFSTWQYNQAQKQATRAQAVTSFVTNLFERAHPDSGGSEAVTLRQIMDDAASRADTELSSTTDVLLDVKSLIASGYYGLGEYDKSLQINEDIYTALSKQADPDTLDYVEALNRLGSSYTAVGQPDAAIPLHQEASDRLNESGMEQSRAMAGTLSRLSEALWAKDDQLALETKIKSLEVTQLSYPKNHHMIARRLAEVGNKYRNIGEHDKAIKFREDALEIASKSGLKHDPFFIGILCNTALDYGSTGHHAKAVEMLKRCLNMRIDRLGADHSENIATQNNIGAYAIALGNVDDAQNVLGDAYTRAQTALPEAAVSRLAVEINYAISLWHSGKAENAQPIIQSVLTRMEGAFGMESPPAKRARAILARLALENGDLQRAKALSKQSFGGLTPVWNADANLWAAEIALADGDLNAAAEYAKTAFSERQTVKDFTDWQIAEAQWIYGLATSNENAIKTAKETLQNLPKHHLRHPNNLPAGFTPVGIK